MPRLSRLRRSKPAKGIIFTGRLRKKFNIIAKRENIGLVLRRDEKISYFKVTCALKLATSYKINHVAKE